MRIFPSFVFATIFGLAAGAAQAACGDYPDQATAQRAFNANPVALRALDRDNDKIACETYRYPKARTGSSMGRPKTYWNNPDAYVLRPVPRYFTQWPRD